MILKEIEERTSVRRYSDKEISENDIKEILEAGRIAPSWVNAQPWHFIAVKDNETKKKMPMQTQSAAVRLRRKS